MRSSAGGRDLREFFFEEEAPGYVLPPLCACIDLLCFNCLD